MLNALLEQCGLPYMLPFADHLEFLLLCFLYYREASFNEVLETSQVLGLL